MPTQRASDRRVLSVAGAALAFGAVLVCASGRAFANDELAAAAAASGRPSECVATSSGGATIWAQARTPFLPRFCALLARAHARMDEDPSAAQRAAEDAARMLPGHAAASVAMARAELRMHEVNDAAQHFEEALRLDPRAVEQPIAMLDLARVRRMRGDNAGALAVYRALVPRATLLPTRDARATALIEAALTTMAVAGGAQVNPTASPSGPTPPSAPGPGVGVADLPASLDEALAYLREAAHDPNHGHRLALTLVLALALDRQGQAARADGLLDELPRGPRLGESLRGLWLGDDGDAFALRALAAERSDRAAARDAWQRFLATPLGKGPWGRRASERLAALDGRPDPARPPRPGRPVP